MVVTPIPSDNCFIAAIQIDTETEHLGKRTDQLLSHMAQVCVLYAAKIVSQNNQHVNDALTYTVSIRKLVKSLNVHSIFVFTSIC